MYDEDDVHVKDRGNEKQKVEMKIRSHMGRAGFFFVLGLSETSWKVPYKGITYKYPSMRTNPFFFSFFFFKFLWNTICKDKYILFFF